jgi:hypothetical protein
MLQPARFAMTEEWQSTAGVRYERDRVSYKIKSAVD